MNPIRKLIVIVPAYNEEARIAETVIALKAALPNTGSIHSFVYVVNDGSRDATQARANEAGADKILVHYVNQGLGAAVRTGLMAAHRDGADVIVKFDADLQHDPSDIAALIQPVLKDEADLVYGNRFARIEYKMPLIRSWGNKVFLAIMRHLTGWPLKDSQPGIFAMGPRYASVFNLPGDYNYTQQILLDAYLKDMRFAHVDVAFRKRVTGKSFVTLKYPFRVLPQILMVLASVKPMRIFFPIGMFFLLLGTGVFLYEFGEWLFVPGIAKPVRSVNLVMGAGLFGLQTIFFGILAELIIKTRR